VNTAKGRYLTEANKIHICIVHLAIPFAKVLEASFNSCGHLIESGVLCHIFPRLLHEFKDGDGV
jgi:hypothetical protein